MRSLAAVIAALAVAGTAAAAAPRSETAAEDVHLLAAEMERLHPDLFHSVSRADFQASVEGLVARLPALDRDQVLVEVMRMAALPGERDGHTGAFPFNPENGRELHGYPIRLHRFADGTFVIGALGRPDLVGSRLVAVEGLPLGDVVERVRPLVSRDNAMTVEARIPEWLVAAEVLHGLGIAASAERAAFRFETPTDGTRDVTLEPVPASEHARVLGGWYEAPVGPRRPLWARYRGRSWAVASIANGTVAYMAYNQVARGVASPADQLLRLARRPKVRRIVVDVRFNGGGDNTTYGALLQALMRPAINRPGRLVVLIGRLTFSAAGNFVADVDRRTRAVFVGEPTGGSPSEWGDAVSVRLPTVGLAVHVATRYHEFGPAGDSRLATEPDVSVPFTSEDFFAGRDPVLAAALRLPS